MSPTRNQPRSNAHHSTSIMVAMKRPTKNFCLTSLPFYMSCCSVDAAAPVASSAVAFAAAFFIANIVTAAAISATIIISVTTTAAAVFALLSLL